jgi:hypothetical protein
MRSSPHKPRFLFSLVAAGALALAGLLAGCGQDSSNAANRVQAEQELQALRESNQELQRLKTENQELPRLRRDNEEVIRLREQTKDLEKLRQENAQLRAEIEAAKHPKKP